MVAPIYLRSNARVLSRTPMGRCGLREEIAAAIAFLFVQCLLVNGVILLVDGGYSAGGI